MRFPSVTQYAASVRNPFGLFRTLGEPVCETDEYGPILFSGGNSVVFRIALGGRKYALKCYTKPRAAARALYDYVASHSGELLCPSYCLRSEIYVYDDDSDNGRWYDAVLMPWIDGGSLESEVSVAAHAGDRKRLAELADMFDRMAVHLLCAAWAHGDLKPENILIDGDRMRLVDYDALYVPGLSEPDVSEGGTPKYRHPARRWQDVGPWVDDYPAALISVSLHALALCPELYARYNTADNIIFDPAQIVAGTSKCYARTLELFAREGCGQLWSLARMLDSPRPELDGLRAALTSVIEGCDCVASADELRPAVSGGLWGYRTRTGRTAIPFRYGRALEFSEGMAAVDLGGYNHFIDASGRTVLRLDGYGSVKSFSGRLAAVKRGERWGYIDRSGREVVPPLYRRASSVRDGKIRIWDESGEILENEVVEGRIVCLCKS